MSIITTSDINARLLDVERKRLEFDFQATANGLVATPGGTQATSLTVTFMFNRVTTVATAGDAIRMPPATASTYNIVISNAAAVNSMNVFPGVGDAINAGAANAAFAIAAGKTALFTCIVNGTWSVITSA